MGYEQALELRTQLYARFTPEYLNRKSPTFLENCSTLIQRLQEVASDDPRDTLITGHNCRLIGEWGRTGTKDGSPYYWSSEMCLMLESVSEDMPTWTLRPETVPSDSGFMYFATPLRLPIATDGVALKLRAISFEVAEDGSGIGINFWMQYDDEHKAHVPAYPMYWMFGESNDEQNSSLAVFDREDSKFSQCARYLAAAFALMEQRIIAQSAESAPRSTRKRLRDQADTLIQIVHLRRTDRSVSERHDGPKAYELTVQFVVRMHWRHHYYPSDGSHRPILIAPYVKGPEGAPLKVQADRVFVVDR